MTDEAALTELFGRWEEVWHEGRYELIPGCVGPEYIRHDEAGDRTVTAQAYATEIAQAREARPDTRFVVYDHSFAADRAWFRFTLTWTDPTTGDSCTRAGMQLYRTEDARLVETWLMLSPLGSAWPDLVAQERWTSAPAASS